MLSEVRATYLLQPAMGTRLLGGGSRCWSLRPGRACHLMLRLHRRLGWYSEAAGVGGRCSGDVSLKNYGGDSQINGG